MSVDYENEMAFAVVVGPIEHERIVAASCTTAVRRHGWPMWATWSTRRGRAQAWRRCLHRRTAEYAAGHGVRGFTADVLPHNTAMLYVFRRGDHDTTVTMEDGVCEIRLLFRQPPEGAS